MNNMQLDEVIKSIKHAILGKDMGAKKRKNVNNEELELTIIANEVDSSQNALTEQSDKSYDLESDGKCEISDETKSDVIDSMKNYIKEKANASDPGRSQNLEDLVASLVRPYVIKWLDGNLARIVNEIVRHEVDKLTKDLD